MKNNIAETLKDNLIIKTCQFFIISCFIFIAVLVWKWRIFPPELPLFYSLPRGSEQLGTPTELLILPALSIAVFILHFLIAVFLYNREKLAARLLIISAFVNSLTILLTFIKIVFLVS